VKPIAVEATAVESAKSAAVETPATATAMRPSVGEIWLAQRGSTHQSSCDCQSPSHSRPGFRLA
jgi:hypothetical protein